jgi:hypothetical protein
MACESPTLAARTPVLLNLDLSDIVGTIGVVLISYAYFALVVRRMESSDMSYSAMNAVGAAMILYSLIRDFNFAAFLMELFWLVTSLIGMGLALRARRTGP